MPSPSAQTAVPPGLLRFSVLGPLTVHRDDRTLPLGPLKQRVVLATLLGSANSPVTVDALTDAVWQDEPPRTARKNLQVYVSALRALLADDDRDRPRLAHTGGGYVLRVAEDELDLLRFRSLVRAAEGQEPRTAARLLRQALDLWQGPPLGDDLRQSPRLTEEAERLELHHLSAYESWAEAELELGGAAAVVEGLRDLVERHPLRERLRSAWMCALSGSGRQAEALAAYDDYRQLLARELGLDPGGAMTARYRMILAGDGRSGAGGAARPCGRCVIGGRAIDGPAARPRRLHRTRRGTGALTDLLRQTVPAAPYCCPALPGPARPRSPCGPPICWATGSPTGGSASPCVTRTAVPARCRRCSRSSANGPAGSGCPGPRRGGSGLRSTACW